MFAAIYVPHFSLQAALRLEPDGRTRPVAMVDPQLPKPVIVELNAAARANGVAAGLTASQAMARCSDLNIKTRSLPQEEAATEILLQTAYAFSASIEATAGGVCTLDLKGLGLASELARQEWAGKIMSQLAAFYFEARVGIAPTPSLALLAARAANPILSIEQPHEFISLLPVSALEPSPPTAEILRRWGIESAGQLIALTREKVAERLGAGVLALFDRVDLNQTRPLKVISPPEHFTEQIEFEKEIETMEPLLFILRRFVEQLSRRLESVYLVVAEFRLQLGLASGVHYERIFTIPSPTGNVETLFRTLRTHLETVRTDAPIRLLQLSARPAQPEMHQFGLFEATVRNPNQFAETLARLAALCGAENAGTPVPTATHRPDTFQMKKPDFVASLGPVAAPRQGLALRRFRPALSARVDLRETRPARLRCLVFDGAITQTQGPYMYSGDWWEGHRWAREEWDVETFDGALFRIFMSSEGCFVEGIYD